MTYRPYYSRNKTKKKGKATFYLYCPKTKKYLSKASINPYYRIPTSSKILKDVLHFNDSPTSGFTKDEAQNIWLEYEFRRRKDNPQLHKMQVVEVERKIVHKISAVIKEHLSDADIIKKTLGKTLGDAMAGAPEGFNPVTAVKRKGKTSGLCKNLTDQIYEKGVYTFFADDDDATLAKVKLGTQYVREYDIAGTLERFKNENSHYT